MTKKNYTPNDQRSIVKNPNNAQHGQDQANRASQGEAQKGGTQQTPPPKSK